MGVEEGLGGRFDYLKGLWVFYGAWANAKACLCAKKTVFKIRSLGAVIKVRASIGLGASTCRIMPGVGT